MKRKELLATYIPIANFIAAMDKEHCEVVIHDVRDLEHSIFYVTEPSLTFRYRGNGMPEFARKLIENKQYLRKSHIVNYLSESAQKTFRSSTFFIMDGKELAGLMCVNTEIGYLLKGIETMKEAIVMNPYGLSTIQEFGAGTTVEERMEVISAECSWAKPRKTCAFPSGALSSASCIKTACFPTRERWQRSPGAWTFPKKPFTGICGNWKNKPFSESQ